MAPRGRPPRVNRLPPPDPITAAIAAMREEFAATREADMKRIEEMRQQDRELVMKAMENMMTQMRGPQQERPGAGQIPVAQPVNAAQGNANQEGEASVHLSGERPRVHLGAETVVPPVVDREARERLYNAFRKHSPPHYKGGRDPIAALEWLQEMERIFEIMSPDDPTQLLYAAYMLQGDAADWWRNTRNLLECQGYAITWPLFERQFVARYFPDEARERKKHELEDLRQGGMSVDEYLSKFNKLAKYACYGRAPLSPEDKAFRFKKGLNDFYADRMAGQNPRDFTELVRLCLNIQEHYRARGKDMGNNKNFNGRPNWQGKNKGLQVKQNSNQFKKNGNPRNGNPRDGQMRKANGNQTMVNLPPCATCGKRHFGVCRLEQIVCYSCGQKGHYSSGCPQKGGQLAAIQACTIQAVPMRPHQSGASIPHFAPTPSAVASTSAPTEEFPVQASARVYTVTQREAEQSPNLVRGTISIGGYDLSVLFDSGATHSFISGLIATGLNLAIHKFDPPMVVKTAAGAKVPTSSLCKEVKFIYEGKEYEVDLVLLEGMNLHVILGMDWLVKNGVMIDCCSRRIYFAERKEENPSLSLSKMMKTLREEGGGYLILDALIGASKEPSERIPVVCDFEDVFPEEIPQFPPERD